MNSSSIIFNKIILISEYYKRISRAKIRRITPRSKQYDEIHLLFIEYYLNHKEAIYIDYQMAIRDYLKDNPSKNNSEYSFKCFDRDGELDNTFLLYIIELHIFYRLYKMRYIEEVEINKLADLEPPSDNEKKFWYRGQTNKQWTLVPSFFRNPNISSLWKWKDIYEDYSAKPNKVSLIRKLNEVDIVTRSNPYKTAAFIQHSIGYSPMIDFSRSPMVSLSFALANVGSMVDFYGNDSCVFRLDISEWKPLTHIEDIDYAIKTFSIQVFKENESISTLITNQMWISFLTYTKRSSIQLIQLPTNDRMLFQKGTFILYDNAMTIGNEVFMSIDKIGFLQSRLLKFIIKSSIKELIYEQLMSKFPQYHQMYLLNPYIYLSEPNK